MVKIKVVSEDMGVVKNGSKHELPYNIPLHSQRLNYEVNVCELKDHVGEKGWSSNWSTKLGFAKKTPPTSFPNHLLKNA